jgi:hypothetical protein
MAAGTLASRLDVVILALRGAGLKPRRIVLSPKHWQAVQRLGAVCDARAYQGVHIDPVEGRSGVEVDVHGVCLTAPLKLSAFADWFALVIRSSGPPPFGGGPDGDGGETLPHRQAA